MNLKIDDLEWDSLPTAVKAHLLDLHLKQQAAEEAKPEPVDPRGQKVVYHPFGPKPLTRPDGTVVYKNPQQADWDHPYEAHCREQRLKLLTKVSQ